jgi:uncharacterized protein (UPF0262 family)
MADRDPGQTARIANIALDEHTIIRRSPEIEHERAVAIYDLLEDNHFAPLGDGFRGPYDVGLSVQENRLLFTVSGTDGQPQGEVALSLTPFRRVVKDYFTICDSYFQAIKTAPPSRIETIDMARRSLHDEGSELLQRQLSDKIEVDFPTARRLFTLICVLHLKG